MGAEGCRALAEVFPVVSPAGRIPLKAWAKSSGRGGAPGDKLLGGPAFAPPARPDEGSPWRPLLLPDPEFSPGPLGPATDAAWVVFVVGGTERAVS